MGAIDTAALLALHRPLIQYDALESYYADWAAVISDRPGNVLKRADGAVIAAAGQPFTLDAPAPPAPTLAVSVDPDRNMAKINYAIPDAPGEAPASSLVIGIDTSGGALPPATTVIPLDGEAGVLEAPLPPGADSVDVRATTHSSEGAVSDTATAGT